MLETLASYGDRFRLETLDDDPAWIPCEELLDPESPALARVLEAERTASGQVSDHATALTVMAVYAGQVTVGALLGWVLGEGVLDVSPSNVAVRLSDHHGFESVGVREGRVDRRDDPTAEADLVVRRVLTDHLVPLTEALHEATRAGRRQLLGGVVQGCAAAFSRVARDDLGRAQRAWATFLDTQQLGLERLGELVLVTAGERQGLVYLRRTCCLYYTSAEQEYCTSCCLLPTDERLALYREALLAR